MQDVILNLTFSTIPQVVLRDRHALILVRTSDGRFVLGKKKHYPPGISRLVGGGIETHEDPQEGASRELAEELLITVPPQYLRPLAKVIANIHHHDRDISFTTWIYFYQLEHTKIQAHSDLDELSYLDIHQYQNLIENYKKLPTELHPKLGFAWYDYGQLYSQIHQIALDEYLKLAQS